MREERRFFLLLAVILWSASCLAASDADLVLVGGKVYPSPDEAPIENAVVVIHNGKIQSITKHSESKGGYSAKTIDCSGKIIVAGFWNSHVHFETGWQDATKQPAAQLETHIQEMLTRWGFTTVWDLGSQSDNTMALRRRVDSGDVPGPKILMAGDIFPKNGHPVYLPAEMQLPEAGTPHEAEEMTQQYMKAGFEGLKLFTGAYMGNKPVVNMPPDIVKAAVDVAHAQGKPVFAHPQNYAGTDNALAGGVDILAHTIPSEQRYTDDELSRMKRQHVALIPTLTLWTTVVSDPATQDQLVQAGVHELKQYFYAGGTILFGTDVGFTSKYDTTQEFEYMGRAMSWHDILASLTTKPVRFFKAANQGRVDKGMDADLVVLNGDPAADVRNFAKVAYTIRDGRVIYSATTK